MYLGMNREEAWVLEFVDFGGEGRRETWYAIVKEVITAYWFMGEYGPKQDDPMLPYMDGSKEGRKKAINAAINSIARLQVLITCSSFSLYFAIIFSHCHFSHS